MKKPLIITGIVLAVLIIAAVAVYFLVFRTVTPIGTLNVLSGNVEVNTGTSWKAATNGMELQESDSVRTNDGKARIVLLDSAILTLDPNTEVSLKEISAEKIAVEQDSGKVWNKFMKVSGVGEYSVETPTTVATVRGTAFKSETENGSDTILVSEDNVDVTSGGNTKNLKQFGKLTSSNGQLNDGELSQEELQELYDSAVADLNSMKSLRIEMLQRNGAIYEQLKTQYNMDDAGVAEFLEKIDKGWINDEEMAAQSPVKLPVLEKLLKIDKEIKDQIALVDQIKVKFNIQ